MNLLIEGEDNPLIWRGALIGKAITQLWGDVMWGNLDYLLIDLPPGTSDAALTIMHLLPVDGIVMVTTPQSLATMIVNKAVNMAIRIGVPIIGVVENMAYYPCPDTGKKHMIFGDSNGEKVAKAAHAPLLAQIPLNPVLTQLCDFGEIEDIEFAETITLMETFEKAMPVKNISSHQIEQGSEKLNQWSVVGTLENSKQPVIKQLKSRMNMIKLFRM
jgi:MinD superfamily P-loop ATPase